MEGMPQSSPLGAGTDSKPRPVRQLESAPFYDDPLEGIAGQVPLRV